MCQRHTAYVYLVYARELRNRHAFPGSTASLETPGVLSLDLRTDEVQMRKLFPPLLSFWLITCH